MLVVIVVCVNHNTKSRSTSKTAIILSPLSFRSLALLFFSLSHFSYKEDCSVNVSFVSCVAGKKYIPGREMVGCV